MEIVSEGLTTTAKEYNDTEAGTGFAFWDFQEKRNSILAILVQKPENPLET